MIKTLVTIGPASLNEISLQYFSKKTKLFRLNGSHSDLAWHQKAVEMIRNYCPDAFILNVYVPPLRNGPMFGLFPSLGPLNV